MCRDSWSVWDGQRQGQRREPATGSVRIATRRVGWRPFAGPSWLGFCRVRSENINSIKQGTIRRKAVAVNSEPPRSVLEPLVVRIRSDRELSEKPSQLSHCLCLDLRAGKSELAATTGDSGPRLNHAASAVSIVVNMNTDLCYVIGRLDRVWRLGKGRDRRVALGMNLSSGHADHIRPDRDSRRNAHWRVRLPNAKVSDGSQPPGAPASPLGVPAGSRSLDRHGSIESEVLLEGPRTQAGRGHRPSPSRSL